MKKQPSKTFTMHLLATIWTITELLQIQPDQVYCPALYEKQSWCLFGPQFQKPYLHQLRQDGYSWSKDVRHRKNSELNCRSEGNYSIAFAENTLISLWCKPSLPNEPKQLCFVDPATLAKKFSFLSYKFIVLYSVTNFSIWLNFFSTFSKRKKKTVSTPL